MEESRLNNDVFRRKVCVICGIKYSSVADLERHLFEEHEFWNDNNLTHNILSGDGETSTQHNDVTFHEKNFVEDVFTEYTAEVTHLNMKSCEDLFSYLFDHIDDILTSELKKKKSIKASIAVETLFSKQDASSGKEILTDPPPVFNSFQHAIFNKSMVLRFLRTVCTKITLDHEYFTVLRSGWSVSRIESISLKVIQIKPIKGGSYIEIPLSLRHKERSGCLLNIYNPPDECGSQNLCFVYSILAHDSIGGLQGKNRSRYWRKVDHYKDPLIFQKINTNGMVFPIDISRLDEQMQIFHSHNKDISVSIFGYHEKDETKSIIVGDVNKWSIYIKKQERLLKNIFPLYAFDSFEQRPINVDLLLLFNKDMTQSHFVLIRSLSSLLRFDNKNARFPCRKCFQQFVSLESLEEHKSLCVRSESILRFPTNKELSFKDFQKTLLVPYSYFFDCESYLEKPKDDSEKYIHHHKCAGYSYNCIDWNGNLVASSVYIQEKEDEDPMELFLLEIFADIKCRIEVLDEFQKEAYSKMIMNDIDLSSIINGKDKRFTSCGFCKKSFKGTPSLHHSHLPPFNFEFLSCNECNIQGRLPYIFNVIGHNIINYDNCHLMQSIHKINFGEVEVLAKSREKMLSIIIRIQDKNSTAQIRFIDSLSFLQSSLSNIANCMYNNGEGADKFSIVRSEFLKEVQQGVPEKYLFSKLAFPYNSLTCFNDLANTNFLDIHLYKNDLTKEEGKEEDLRVVKDICKILKLDTLRDLVSLYCRLDVALLASVFTQFRLLLYKTFNVDCLHYFSLPSFSYACAMLGCTEELEYITQKDIYRFVLRAKRGGYSSIGCLMFAEASNPYLPSHLYDPTKPESYLTYLDANSLYGFSLMAPIPTRNFHFLKPKVQKKLLKNGIHEFLANLDINGDKGYFFDVDLIVPERHHNKMDDLPLAIEMKAVSKDQLSDYQLHFKEELDPTDSIFQTKRLIGDLHPKYNYVCHSRTLKKYVELGLEVIKVHNILEFSQSAFFKPYIETLMNFRRNAKTKFESDTWKLQMNSLFGYTILDRERMMNVKIVTDKTKALALSNSPLLDEIISINKNLLLFVMKRKSILLNSPIQIGITVLEVSKAVLYSYYYEVLKVNVPSAKIIIVDTDGLLIHSRENIYEFMLKTKEHHDMSAFNVQDPLFSKYHCMDNQSKAGVFKDENSNSILYQAVSLRPKMYCFKYVKRNFNPISKQYEFVEGKNMEVKKAKGIPKMVAKSDLTMAQYFHALFSPKYTSVSFNTIRRKKHQLYTVETSKKALCSLDVKRYRVCPTTTLAYGNKAIDKIHRKGISYEIDADVLNGDTVSN